MTKKFWIMGAVILILALAAGTITAQSIWEERVENQPEKEIEEEAPEKCLEPEESMKGEGEEDRDREDINLRKGEGMLTGRIDSHSVEIKVKGNHQAFGLSEEMRDKEFAPGDISFKYYVDDQGRSIITQADFQSPRESEVHTTEGIFRGKADSHTVEIEIEGKPRAFGVEENLSFAGIDTGQELFIAYQEDDRGREVIIKIEKIF